MSSKLLEMQTVVIEAEIDGEWRPIVNGLSLALEEGEIVGSVSYTHLRAHET